MDIDIWTDLLITGVPISVIAGGSVYALYKFTMRQMDQNTVYMERFVQVSVALNQVHQALGEVTEALRRLNGKGD